MRFDVPHEQADTRPPPHDELASDTASLRKRGTLLIWLHKEMIWLAPHADSPLNLLIDSTGIKFLGDSEWQARKRGVWGPRQWRKVRLAVVTATSDIRAVEFTPSSDGDGPVLPELLDQTPEGEKIGTPTAKPPKSRSPSLMHRFSALGTAEIVRVA